MEDMPWKCHARARLSNLRSWNRSARTLPISKFITKVDDSFHIEFQSIAGKSYRVEWTDDLVAGKWTVLTDAPIT